MQFLPDVEIVCPACRGSRYADAASHIHREGKDGSLLTLPQLMDMSVDEAIDATVGLKKVQTRLQTLHDLGLGYLTLGEPTPALSGGEAQRLKLASEMGRVQDDAVFVFGVAHELGFEPEVSYIHSPRTRTYASRDEAYHALLKTLDYRDPSIEQVDRETATQRLRDWLLIHLIPGKEEGTWQLDKPQIVPWAFISWKTS